jgi:hypothetical protein
MAKKKLYLLPPASNAVIPVTSEDVPADALMSPTGMRWNTSTGNSRTGSNESAFIEVATTVPPSGFTDHVGTPKPTTFRSQAVHAKPANGWRSADAYTGSFVPGVWNFSFNLTNDSSNNVGADFRVAMRLFKSLNTDGTALSEITGGIVYTNTQTATLTTSGTTESTILTAEMELGEIVVANHYIFLATAIHIIVAESNTVSRTVTLRKSANTFMETSDLQPPGITLIGAVGI